MPARPLVFPAIRGSLWQRCECYLRSPPLTRVIPGLLPGSEASLGGNNDSGGIFFVPQGWPCIRITDALLLRKEETSWRKKTRKSPGECEGVANFSWSSQTQHNPVLSVFAPFPATPARIAVWSPINLKLICSLKLIDLNWSCTIANEKELTRPDVAYYYSMCLLLHNFMFAESLL